MIVQVKLILKNVTFSKNYGPLPKPKQKKSHLTGIKDIVGECKEKHLQLQLTSLKKSRYVFAPRVSPKISPCMLN